MNKKTTIDELLKNGLFSEYLPFEFNTKSIDKNILTEKFDTTKTTPLSYTMWKQNDNIKRENRRVISIPNIIDFINLIKQLNISYTYPSLLNRNSKNKHSLSKAFYDDGCIRQFNIDYVNKIIIGKEITAEISKKDFISNLDEKLRRAKACECILHLDISNFFGSVYTHFITSITKGEDWAQKEYEKKQENINKDKNKKEKISQEYTDLDLIDERFRNLNKGRTHGLLLGPRVSFVIAEFLLTQIDVEIERELKGLCDFVRYVDDYEFFIDKKSDVEKVILLVRNTLNRYGFVLNDLKTKIEEFPFYSYINFEKVNVEQLNISEKYSLFANIEKQNIQNGALYFFINQIMPTDQTDKDIALNIAFNIIKNIPESLIRGCVYIENSVKLNNKSIILENLSKMLYYFLDKNYDIETIWLINLILKIDSSYSFKIKDIDRLNDIAKIIIYYNSSIKKYKNHIINKSGNNWLLNYELYFNNDITDKMFLRRTKQKSNLLSNYEKLKALNIHFYNSSKEQ